MSIHVIDIQRTFNTSHYARWSSDRYVVTESRWMRNVIRTAGLLVPTRPPPRVIGSRNDAAQLPIDIARTKLTRIAITSLGTPTTVRYSIPVSPITTAGIASTSIRTILVVEVSQGGFAVSLSLLMLPASIREYFNALTLYA